MSAGAFMTQGARLGKSRCRLRAAALGVLITGLLALGGCIVIPLNYHSPGFRHNMTTASTNLVEVGVTTREQVLLAWGEPDFVSEDGQRFGYGWSKVRWGILWATPAGGSFHELAEGYLVETTFAASNRVARVRFLRGYADKAPSGLEP